MMSISDCVKDGTEDMIELADVQDNLQQTYGVQLDLGAAKIICEAALFGFPKELGAYLLNQVEVLREEQDRYRNFLMDLERLSNATGYDLRNLVENQVLLEPNGQIRSGLMDFVKHGSFSRFNQIARSMEEESKNLHEYGSPRENFSKAIEVSYSNW